MNFKSQISTTCEQSQRLLDLGVKPETADMVYHHTNSRISAFEWELQVHPPVLRGDKWTSERISKLATILHKHPDGTPMTGEEVFDSIWGQDIPSWSLSRLLEMMPHSIEQSGRPNADLSINTDSQYWFVTYEELGYDTKHQTMKHSLFDAIVDMIEWLIWNGYFNEEYLKHRNVSSMNPPSNMIV